MCIHMTMMRNSSSSSLNSACSAGEGSATGTGTTTVLKKGPWTAAEDAILIEYVQKHGEGNWNSVQKNCGLARCGKSCRLRWANHLRPNLKKGSFTPEEEMLILQLQAQLGNKWARMAAQLPGRTDNEIKNFWNTRIKRRQRAGLPVYSTELQIQQQQQQPRMGSLRPPPITVPPTSPSAPSSPLQHSPLPQHSPLSSPLPLFTNSLPPHSQAMPFLFPNSFCNVMPDAPRIKRIRDDGLSFQFPLSPAVSSHVHQTAATTTNNMFQYNYGNMNSPSSSMLMYSAPPVETELPSTQSFNTGGGSSESGCGLLDALLQEVQGSGDVVQEEQVMADPIGKGKDYCDCENGSSNGDGKDSFMESFPKLEESSWCSNGINLKRERPGEMNSVSTHDDISKLFDMISTPSMPAAPEWYNTTDSREISNGGQSSVVTDDELGLELHHLASLLRRTRNGTLAPALGTTCLEFADNFRGITISKSLDSN